MPHPTTAPSNALTNARGPLVAPSILSADFAALADDCAHALDHAPHAGGADLLHIDIMDGHFVPNLTMGPALLARLRDGLASRGHPNAFFDVHLMVTDPAQYLTPFADAGAHHITFHIEPALDRHAGSGAAPLSLGYDPGDLIDRIHALGLTAGLAINPDTPAHTIDPWIDRIDLALVMSVNPGFSGQKFIERVLDKVRSIRPRLRPNQRLQMDGGLSPANARLVRDAGCDVLVAASAFFGVPRPERGAVSNALRAG